MRLAVLAVVVVYDLPHVLRPAPPVNLSAREFVTANLESAAAELVPPDVARSIDTFIGELSRASPTPDRRRLTAILGRHRRRSQMNRSFSHTAQIVLCTGVALGSVQESATAQSFYNGAMTKLGPAQGGQGFGGPRSRHLFNGIGRIPVYSPVVGGGAHRGDPQFGRGPYAGYPSTGGGFHPGPWNRTIGGGGLGYGGHGFGGVPIGVGGMAGPIFAAGATPAANSANAEQASPPPWRRPRHPAAERAPAPAPPPAKAIARAPPPTPVRTIVHAAPPPPILRLASTAHPPPPTETRFRPGEVLVATAPGVPRDAINAILRSHRLTEADVASIGLTGQSLRLWRFPISRPVPDVVRELGREIALASIQPNYIYAPQDDAANASPPVLKQYWLANIKVDKSLDTASGKPVRVAVIDTAIDEVHPDLNGSIVAEFDAIGGTEPPYTRDHGTSMAGAIAAHGWLKGVAPTVRILSARALDRDDRGLELGSTQSVMKAVQWAFEDGARIVNMSFAGPVEDPGLHAELAAAYAKGLVLIGAAGNDGPKAPPRYPGADENVVAVTATDENNRVYAMANAGSYIAVAAPGVDVLLASSHGSYAMETGTSVSAALVSGVAALLVERRPDARPFEVKGWLMKTAEPLTSASRLQAGAGLVDARRAAEAAARSAGPALASGKAPGS